MLTDIVQYAPIGTALSAIIAVCGFVFFLIDRRRNARSLLLKEWRTLAVFNVIEKKYPEPVSVESIKTELQSKAFEYVKIQLRLNDISKEVVEKIVFELVRSRIVDIDQYQRGYSVSRHSISKDDSGDFEQAMDSAGMPLREFFEAFLPQAQVANAVNALRGESMKLVFNNPAKYSVDSLAIAVSKSISHDLDDARLFIARLVSEGVLIEDEKEKLVLPRKPSK